jgi:hypothetical protein
MYMIGMRPLVLFLAGCLVFTGQALAEGMTVTKQYNYHATEADNKQSARWYALEQTRRLLLEELCTHLEDVPEVRSFNLSKEEIISLTAGITHTEILKEEKDGENYLIEAKISADIHSTVKSLDELRSNKGLKRELERENDVISQALQEKELLNKQLDAVYYDANTEFETYESMVQQIVERQKEGARLLALAKDSATKPGMEKQTREYRQRAIKLLGEAMVQTELPEFKIYVPGNRYTFSLREGEQTDHWITFPGSGTEYKLSQAVGSKFTRVYDDQHKNKFKFRAIKNSFIVLKVTD